MFMLDMLGWWWTAGWKMFASKFTNKLRDAADFFSLRLLITNLFAPFRQIATTTTTSSQLSAFFDRLVSRLVGTIVRLFLLIVGLVILLVQSLVGLVVLILWPLAPLCVVACLVLAVMRVGF